jgi:hypothetical protein
MKRFLPWLALVAGLFILAFVVRQCRNSGAANYQTASITRGPVTQAVTATGTLNPVVNVQVGSQVSGNIAKLFVDFNSQVKAGQVVASSLCGQRWRHQKACGSSSHYFRRLAACHHVPHAHEDIHE